MKIKTSDTVEYIDTAQIKEGKHIKVIKVDRVTNIVTGNLLYKVTWKKLESTIFNCSLTNWNIVDDNIINSYTLRG